MKKVRWYALALLLIASILVPSAFALALTPPTSMNIPSNGVKVFKDLAEIGDRLYVFQFEITPYSANDTLIPASSTIILQLKDSTGNVTQTTSPYVFSFFETNGYETAVGSFYFSAANNVTAPSWGSAAVLNIVPSPAFFPGADVYNRTITSAEYVSAASMEASRAELAAFILLLADRLEAIYSSTGVILKASSDSGIVLSSYGELLFRGAIPGLQALCPQLFFIQVYIPQRVATQTYNMSLGTTYSAREAGKDLQKGFDRLGDVIGGVDGKIMVVIVWLLIAALLCVWTTKKDWGIEAGMFLAAIIGICLSLIYGDAMFTIIMLVGMVAILGIVWIMFQKRA